MSNAVIIIDYGLGNLASVANALKKLEIPYKISNNVDMVNKAEALVLPGVGAASQGMENLKERGLDQVIIGQAKKGTPILGICLGMQLLLSSSEEGNVNCLGLIDGQVKKFKGGSMVIIPAIDIKNGKCVRLIQGNFENEKVYGEDPVAIAQQWREQGAQMLHVVDLDGAKNGNLANFEIIKSITQKVKIP